ncbi:flagellar basal body rod protein FlgB [Natranaerobius thermophilus]|uniref:Flagellar basal body rod protein FlgB n=1 Tax=Natranaerobius thermophilus (strain ATCC BAA-1301 / DSM 18059 / JW/NM-WN-LF) TaxID=457570 RepID=B2A340_NATTJ|nr:flagellar basal body rod protein FlgB [Natranaerobius thermophilus]ACB84971.1 flagellar basal-body rod protein FlgB [Natranaerobius thermophilus JW/NM-WN-LF]
MFEQAPIGLLGNSLNGTTKRHEVISNNIANVNTPGFKRGRVDFEEQLKEAMKADSKDIEGKITREKHIPIGKVDSTIEPQVRRESDSSMRNDDNNVDVDTEMSRLTQNSLHHQALTRQLSSEFNKLRSAIQGGR